MNYFIELSDTRNRFLLRLMQERGYKTFPLTPLGGSSPREWQQENPTYQANAYIFSPARKLGMDEINALPDECLLYAGAVSDEVKKRLVEKRIGHINFLSSAEFGQRNAALTAEGVLALCINATPRSISQNKILILGNGKCAKAIAKLFSQLALDYQIAARSKPDENQNETPCRYMAICELQARISEFDLIINTVPAKIITPKLASAIDQQATLIEVASTSCLEQPNPPFNYQPAPSLPQVYSPETAARLMFEMM